MAATGQPAESVEVQTLGRLVTVSVQNASLREAIDAIAANAKVQIQYRDATLATVTKPVSVSFTSMPLGVVLGKVLDNTRLHAIVTAKNLVTIKPMLSPVQVVQGTIAGKVIDAKTKRPVTRATVFLGDDTQGQTVDEDGTFRISAGPGEHQITVRAVGYSKKVMTATVVEGETISIEIVLDPNASVLDEVVVTGTVIATERRALVTPITVITAEDIETRGITRIEQLFRGEVPGLVAAEQGSMVYQPLIGVMESAEVYARGSASLDGGANPIKTYVDGVEMLDPSYLGTIDPQSIERIEIVVGPQAATVYGAGAMGGVMQIFTKKGHGQTRLDASLSLKYGMLESNLSRGKTPTHNDVLNITGGNGPVFSYAGTLSYRYSGQWQPKLFSRSYGASLGVTHASGGLTAHGSVSVSGGRNGTVHDRPTSNQYRAEGIYTPVGTGISLSQRRATSSGLTLSLSADYRANRFWQHAVSIGRNQTRMKMDPAYPDFLQPRDSLWEVSELTGQRSTLGYNTTIQPNLVSGLSPTFTLGVNGSWGNQLRTDGCLSEVASATYIGCRSGNNPEITTPTGMSSWGGFGQLRVGIMDRMFVSMGVRGEHNKNYGKSHTIDWTPTNGLAYSHDIGLLTVKLMGSYGRATKTPDPEYRLEQIVQSHVFIPGRWIATFANPELTPEYSRGPQAGIELYYGNIAAFTVNHYQQKISDIIQRVVIDSIPMIRVSDGNEGYHYRNQYRNIASVRQRGWEGTGSLTVRFITIRGSYSWADSRIISVDPRTQGYYTVGQPFKGVPTHTGNLSISYASGPTSVLWTTNVIGKIPDRLGMVGALAELLVFPSSYRLVQYIPRRKQLGFQDLAQRKGYAKSDVAISHRISPWMTFTLNVNNIANSYGSEADFHFPALGRSTSVGITLRRSGAR